MKYILVEKNNKIATISLNRVEKYNAFDDQLIAELLQALDELTHCSQTAVIILRGNGKHFSAGADLGWMKRMIDYSQQENEQDSLALAELMSQLYHHPKPIIASAQGCAFGGGVGLIAACDFALCDESAQFCFSEVKLGLIPAVISPYVINAIGERLTKKLFLTAEKFSAQQALSYQLVQQVCANNELEQQTLQLAQQIVSNGPEAIQHSKKLVNDVSGHPMNDALKQLTAERIAERRTSPEGQEGLHAFFDKRKPNWLF